MNTSIEDPASQSSTCDRSESTMSVHLQSPIRSSQASNNYPPNNNNNDDDHNHQMPRQQQQQTLKKPQAEAAPSLYGSNSETYHYSAQSRIQHQHQQYDLRSITGQQQQQQQQTIAAQQHQRIQYQTPPKRAYSGVDKLILAAMLDDAQANQHAPGFNNHLTSAGFIPSGRGIGYHAGQRDTQVPYPSNRSETELYRLLERANLLNYFGTFLNFGGDDVQQLCDADEEEFLEIMSLVGMTQKPLHVRRLQKALIEWRESRDLELSMLRTSHLNYFMAQPATAPATRCDQTLNITGSSSVPLASHHPTESRPSMQPQPKTLTESNQYIPPRDLLVGAPKRIRLLDSLNNRRLEKSDCANAHSGANQPPFKKRFNSNLSLSPKRRGEDRSDEDGSEEDGEIEVMDSSEEEEFESEDDENDVPKSRKITVAKLNQNANDNENSGVAPSKRSYSDLAGQSNHGAADGN